MVWVVAVGFGLMRRSGLLVLGCGVMEVTVVSFGWWRKVIDILVYACIAYTSFNITNDCILPYNVRISSISGAQMWNGASASFA